MNVSVSDEKSALEKDLQRLAHALMQLDAVKVQHSEPEVLAWLLQYAAESAVSSGTSATTSAAACTASPALVQGLMQLALEQLKEREFMASIEHRPQSLACDVWRFQNKKEKWVAFIAWN